MNRIKEARKAAGMSQKYVAMSLGVAGPSVSNWENGKTKPTPENYVSLSQLFGVSVDYLMGNDDPLQAPQRQTIVVDEKDISFFPEFKEMLEQMDDDQLDKTAEYMRFVLSQKNKR